MSGNDMAGEYFQHVYMSLGRARRLDEVLIRNFPQLESGELDWSIFEHGPPDYLVEFTRILHEKAKRTSRKLPAVQGDLGMPAFDDLPECFSDGEGIGRFRYDAHAWSEACQVTASMRKKRSKTHDSGGHALPQLREVSAPQSAAACLAGSAASKRKCEGHAGSAAKPSCEPANKLDCVSCNACSGSGSSKPFLLIAWASPYGNNLCAKPSIVCAIDGYT